jgi:Pentapeptide repeats (8 copies)
VCVALSAITDHIEALRHGPRSWNEWRAQNPSTTPNLNGIVLSPAERQMGPISGGPINFSFAQLRHASLRFATLLGANLEMADLTGADLSDARLDGANLSGADLCDARLERVDLAGAKLSGTNLARANLKDARNLTQGQIYEAFGDALTVLPPYLVRPEGWGGSTSQIITELRGQTEGRRGKESDSASETGGEARSWLVARTGAR